jgi:hypothetical protein
MNDSKKQFVNQLIAADPPSLDARGRYEKEVRAMLENKLTPRQRGVYLVVAALLLLPAVLFGSMVLQPIPVDHEFIRFVWVYMVATAVVLVILAVILFRAYWSGIVVKRSAYQWATGLGVVYIGVLGLLALGVARHVPDLLRDEVRIMGLLLVLYASVVWVRNGISQSELRTTEKLLEIELRVAELTETRSSVKQE